MKFCQDLESPQSRHTLLLSIAVIEFLKTFDISFLNCEEKSLVETFDIKQIVFGGFSKKE